LNTLTREFLKSRFLGYYRKSSLDIPPGLEAREWGFLLFDGAGMRRHKSYLSKGEVMDYLRSMVPAHVYHSAAYYDRPDAPTMKEKGWRGADLIFDLDADHLKKAPESYREMLGLVKQETQKLLSFLFGDFGISEKDASIVFSGGRGYHIHVRDKRVLAMGSDERREVVDYLTGRGLDLGSFIHEIPVAGDCGSESAKKLRAPSEYSPGWGGRVNHSIVSFVERIRSMEEEEAINVLSKSKGIGAKKAAIFYKSLSGDGIMDRIRAGNLDLFKGSTGIWKSLLAEDLGGEGVRVGISLDEERGETDEPVTADVRRLIRCPGSLHGGSGLRVTPLTIATLEDFDPLNDAVVFGEDPIHIRITRAFKTEVSGESYNLSEGPLEVPTSVAVFLMARGVAELR